jgi:hypothetical protein
MSKRWPEKPLLDERLPHPLRETKRSVLNELKAIHELLEKLLAKPPTPIRVPGALPAPAPSAYVDVVAHGLNKFGGLRLAKDLHVETIAFDHARDPPEEFPKLTGIALTIYKNDGTFDLYLNQKDTYHKITVDALTYPQTLWVDWFDLKTVYIGNTAQAGLSATLIAWKPVEAPPPLPPPKAILMITPADREAFHKLGDVNRDGVIDDLDMQRLQAAYGSTPTSPNWDKDCDLNGDGKVDMKDIAIASKNYGLTIEMWKAGS